MKRFLKGFFSFTRKEHTGTLVLTGLILAVLLLRNHLPALLGPAEKDFSEFRQEIDSFEQSLSGEIPQEFGNPAKDGTGGSYPQGPALININAADSSELIRIRGIGPVLSKRIVKYRYLLGGFVSKEQLREVYGIDEQRYALIAGQFCLDDSLIRRININRADLYALKRHPYLEDRHAEAIISYRRAHGGFDRISRLSEEKLLPEDVFGRIRPYLTLE